ncbi:serine/threonine protein kinase [Kibdelosporangium philippinense]|uniref:Serine/threonine protein kinase n=1 Tax=Kibdelosporangium philippinense TaxID=211113 RepID=A0ABS8ZK10_9PSEU|nr:serine/threonine protein kinase [Kibdelosporangium philippinense]MCE7007764.1 serine/threonine protein kinase [Kibdelosporangium philippinense]
MRSKRLTAAAVGVLLALTGVVPAQAQQLRDVVLIGNAQAGTVSFLDGHTFQVIGTLDAIPDLEQRLAAMNPVERIGYETVNRIQGYKKFVDDIALSPDGKTLYVSRGNLADVVAYDVASRRQLWRTKVEGFKADHAAISPDGTQFIVSALSVEKAHVYDTRTGAIVKTFATGAYPHGNDYAPDNKTLYNSSIGNVSLSKAFNWAKGKRQLTAVDPATWTVKRTYQFEYGIRPALFMPDNKTMYAQLSYLNGLVEYDLQAGRIVRTVQLPFSEKAAAMDVNDYPQNSAHHGMAYSGDRICAAGTIDDYTVLLDRPGLGAKGYVHYPTDSLPYWTLTSVDGKHCLVSLSKRNAISVIDYATAKEVASIPVGHFPQRERLGVLSEAAVASFG